MNLPTVDPLASALTSLVTLVVYVGVGLMLAKRLGYPFGPGLLNVLGLVLLLAMCAPILLIYAAFVESPNERRVRELEQEVQRLRWESATETGEKG